MFFALFALAFAAVIAADCNPNSNGKPDCATEKAGNYRNFWDPTAYWVCDGSGSEAVAVRCETNHGVSATMYDSVNDKCVNWADWEWTPPCPEV